MLPKTKTMAEIILFLRLFQALFVVGTIEKVDGRKKNARLFICEKFLLSFTVILVTEMKY